MEYKYTSIVLGKRDVGETDRIYSLYTLEGGKVQALAKGVRKTGAKLAGLLENFTYADITVARSRGMGKITSSVVENNFSSLRSDYYALSKIVSSFNIFNKIVELDHKDPVVFETIKEYLEAIDSQSLVFSTMDNSEYEDKVELLTSVFLLKLLECLGYGGETEGCVECGKKITEEKIAFSAKSGGMVCSECNGAVRSQLFLSVNSVKLMRMATKNNLKSFVRLKVQRKDVNFA
ncbi:MAG: repair protein RecO protein, partial [Candidatus Moranbacteria bacterium GW2011_GWC2_45_10]